MSIRNNLLMRPTKRFCPLLRLPQYRQSDIGEGGWGFEFRYKITGMSRKFEKAIQCRTKIKKARLFKSGGLTVVNEESEESIDADHFPFCFR